MTQGRNGLGRGQGRIVQTGKFMTKAVKRAKRLVLVLALAGVVATSAFVGFGGHPAEAAGYLWWGWVPTINEPDVYLQCTYAGGYLYALSYYGSCDGGPAVGITSCWTYVACYR